MQPGGEYEEEGEKSLGRWELRTFFLEKLAEMAPEVLEHLQTEVLPVYQDAYDATAPKPEPSDPGPFGEKVQRQAAPAWISWRFRDGDWDEHEKDCPEQVQLLWTELSAWARAYNLRDPWLMDTALRTLFFWYHGVSSSAGLPEKVRHLLMWYSRSSIKPLFTDRDIQGAIEVSRAVEDQSSKSELRFFPLRLQDAFVAPRFTFEFKPWVPRHQQWSVYERNVREAFEQKLAEYEAHRRQGPEERNLTPSSEIRNPNHFEWLVLWQVKEESYATIAEKYEEVGTYETETGISSSGVRAGVHDKANRIGLTLRTQY